MPTSSPRGSEPSIGTQPAGAVETLHATPKRGRPKGSVSLTLEIQTKIVEALRAGVLSHVAAELAGVSPRTFFEWIERGEDRHATRSCSPKLKAFAREVAAARAQARAYAEARVYRENPKHWLAHAARSKPGLEGWTEPKEEVAKQESWLDRMLAKQERESMERGEPQPQGGSDVSA